MRAVVACEQHFYRGRDNRVYTSSTYPYPFWRPLLSVFDELTVMARVRRTHSVDGHLAHADGDGVSFLDLPDYDGPWQFIRWMPRLRCLARSAVDKGDAFVLRTPGSVSTLLWWELKRQAKPFGVEIGGDPGESLRWIHGIGPWIARPYTVRTLKRQARTAVATLYRTERALQRKYPPMHDRFTIAVSSVELPDELFQNGDGRRARPLNAEPHLGFIGTLNTLYKCPDVLIKAAGICRERGLSLRLSVVGEGRYRARLEQLTRKLCLEDRIDFKGLLPNGGAIFRFLRGCDLFVLPSRTEGLPRAMLEAMAVGLPCIGTRVGGVPEVLRAPEMVPPGRPTALADKIQELLTDPERLGRLRLQNRDIAERFKRSRRDTGYRKFYLAIKESSRSAGVTQD